MRGISINSSLTRAVAKLSFKAAYGDIENTCVFLIYQPKRPDALKKKMQRNSER